MIELREITWDNFWDVVGLKPTDSQIKYLPTNAVFMAQAYINLKAGDDGDICFSIYCNDCLIGFTKIVLVPNGLLPFDFLEDSYYLDAFMIDAKHQGKGYGRLALSEIIKFIQSKPWGNVDLIKLSCYDENTLAISLYETSGFVRTNRFIKGKDGLRIYDYHG